MQNPNCWFRINVNEKRNNNNNNNEYQRLIELKYIYSVGYFVVAGCLYMNVVDSTIFGHAQQTAMVSDFV